MIPSSRRLLRWPYNLVLNPSALVDSASGYHIGSIRGRIQKLVSTVIFFIVNLVLYTLPLSINQTRELSVLVPPRELVIILGIFVSDAEAAAVFFIRLLENSLLLFYASVLMFIVYHTAVWITRGSNGWIRSLDIITLSTGIYLAIIFTLLLLATSSLVVTGELLRGVQTEFLLLMIDLTGSTHTITTARPIDPNELTPAGNLVLIALAVSISYFGYVLYLGARRVHQLSRLESLSVIGVVAISPAVYSSVALVLIEFTELPPALFGL